MSNDAFLILFMTGIFPGDIMTISGLTGAAAISGQGLVFHMGTNINLRQLMKEWRTLVLAIISMAVAMVSVFAVVPLVGWDAAVVSIPIVNGGIMATNIMVDAALAKGATMAAALGTLAPIRVRRVESVRASETRRALVRACALMRSPTTSKARALGTGPRPSSRSSARAAARRWSALSRSSARKMARCSCSSTGFSTFFLSVRHSA